MDSNDGNAPIEQPATQNADSGEQDVVQSKEGAATSLSQDGGNGVDETKSVQTSPNDDKPRDTPGDQVKPGAADAESEDMRAETDGTGVPQAVPRPEGAEPPSSVRSVTEDTGSAAAKSAGGTEENVEDEYLDEEGRPLSAYEIQRLERIKRNRQKLAQLGLAKPKETVLGAADSETKKNKPARPRKSDVTPLPQRARSNRAKKKNLNYAEPTISVRALLKRAKSEGGEPAQKAYDESADATEGLAESSERKRKWNRETERLAQDVYREFNRIKAHKRDVLKEAQRAVRNADKETRYWTKRVEKYEKTFLRKKDETDEKLALGGKTSRELLAIVDERTPEIQQAIQEYEDFLYADQREHQRAINRKEAEEKMKMLDALVRFPKALKSSTVLLNTALLEGAPKDPPPPRRSKRGAMPDNDEDCKPSSKRKGSKQAKAKALSEETDTISAQEDCSTPFSELNPPDDDDQEDGKAAKQRKRVVRNVGGWISPDFARIVDRRWLDTDVPTTTFDPRSYVPQVGELVLYYITGHKQYLESNPDIIGKKTRSKMRIPLWERAIKLREEAGDEPVSSWWTNQWLDGLETDRYGDYPILCRVERTHAEFPPDPWSKVVKGGDDTTSSGQKIYFKKPQNGGNQTRKQHLRLAVDLRPLTPLVANGNDKDDLPLPPLFSVATSPSKATEPFVLPFCWAYFRSIFLRANQKVLVTNADDDTKIRVDAIDCPPHLGVLSPNDRDKLLAQASAWLENISSKDGSLRDEVGQHFPLHVARFLIHLWGEESRKGEDQDADQAKTPSTSFHEILRKTQPLWNSVSTLLNVYDRKRVRHCPWNLVVSTKRVESVNPWAVGNFKFCLDESLRSKLLCFMDGVLADESASVDLFREAVTDDVAPSYSCAVPIGFSLSRITKRLTLESSTGECFYRTSRQFVADVASILDCALLYNSPESDVVSLASVLTTKIRDAVAVLIREHYREAQEAQMLDDERRRTIQHRFSSQMGTAQSMIIKPFLSRPFRGDVQFFWTESTSSQGLSFQAGDTVQYSAALHEQFVAGHGPSLEKRHSIVHFKSDPAGEWLDAEVVWTRTDFPKALPRQNDKKCDTFVTLSTLQCLGLRFIGDTNEVTIFWRPCLFEETPSICASCKIVSGESFLRLKSNGQDLEHSEDLTRCMDFVKRRCANGLRPYQEDETLTKANVKLGYRPRSTQAGRKAPPAFNYLFQSGTTNPDTSTRKPKTKKQATEVSRLLEIGFVPPWILPSNEIDDEKLFIYKQYFASPSISLELVSFRLHSGFYRHRQAIENDIIEAYCVTVFMLLFDSWNQKKQPLPIKRLARSLASNKNWDVMKATIDPQLGHVETSWMKRLLAVRELFSVSLTMVSDLSHAMRMFGLADAPNKIELAEVPDVVDADEQRAESYRKLTSLLQAVGRDECNNYFSLPSVEGEPPLTKILITIGGEEVKLDPSVYPLPVPAKAVMNNRALFVRLKLENKPVSFPEFVEGMSEDVIGGSNAISRTSPGIYFHVDDYENNDYLARLVFKRPGRCGACARCRAYRRSMMVCRVLRRHANQDFDWALELPGGEAYLNRLVLSLKDDSNIIVDATTASLSLVEDRADINKTAEDEVDTVNPRKMLDRAKTAMDVAEKIVREAETFSETPDRLSAEFIEEAFPIDEGDGHYVYCVICGLAGDLLCCDGCSTVVHMDCIDMSEPPAGDWFCEECVIAGKSCEGQSATAKLSDVVGSSLSYGPFKRANFDESELTAVTEELHDLRAKRPTQKVQDARLEGDLVQESDNDSADGKAANEIEESAVAPVEANAQQDEIATKEADNIFSVKEAETNTTPSRRSKRKKPATPSSANDRQGDFSSDNDHLSPRRTKRTKRGVTEEKPETPSTVTRRSRRRGAGVTK